MDGGIFVLDASDNNNTLRRLAIKERSPEPAADYEVRAFGPFLVIRTRAATGTPARFLELAAAAEEMSRNATTLSLRYLQTLKEVSGSQGTHTIVFPFPTDLMKFFESIGAK